ncbi:MAG TPA: 1,6-anhydro-N-acetylmuramyl-L-alanine amidase AmpD [Candidatus Competibacteraceae bacterium]|nr:1,6-anhydro-N-acetylmuramyl-L-alanine amidase AmpD [Candidatus Competibacteraceae bacterium]HRZ05762.1 1,6-anhydro-N-acetylmuramyl-L-alanine amidase AmpD [Candidatus Competibacteraceae bacterium]HSA45740.1 1,6-anhydro-N-acetylmuramyl-L-alanine amidase AmpD [Candidatus Competibacteraceae bacterium]
MRIDPVTGLLHTARQAPSPNSDDRLAGTAVELIVIHGISLPPGEFGGPWIDALFTNTLDPAAHPYFQAIAGLCVSAHLLIRRDGEVVQYVPFHRRAWHAGESVYAGRHRCNDFSIGIELEGADHLPYDDRQYPLLATVIRTLWQAYPTITPDRLVGHADIAPGRKTDPGPAFDWSRLRRLLNEARFQDDAPHSERPSVATLASAPLIESQSPS